MYILCSPERSPHMTGINVLNDPVTVKESSKHCPAIKLKNLCMNFVELFVIDLLQCVTIEF